MKHILAILLAFCLLLTACTPGGNEAGQGKAGGAPTPEPTSTPDPTAEMQGDLELFILHELGGGTLQGADFAEVIGMFGGSMYVPKRYAVKLNEFGEVNSTEDLPREHVTYTVTGYPDVLDSKQYVTGVEITDPAVHVFGITTEASAEEFMAAVTACGLKAVTPKNMSAADIARLDYACAEAPDGKWYVAISNTDGIRTIRFSAPTTNEWGVMF
ncbi:MAG: hypothetical protein IKO51_10890 [Clostridia bacterium]|nr:hypothetical protein [Clostridia bacterium]